MGKIRRSGTNTESARRQPETQVEYTRRFKRKAETDREQLEREIREDSEELLQTNMDFDWFWVGSGEPVLVASLGTLEGPASFAPATSPEMFSGSLDSVCFNRSNEHDFVKMRLGGQDVLVWKPDSIIDDQSLQELDLEQGFKGMQEEVRNLEWPHHHPVRTGRYEEGCSEPSFDPVEVCCSL